MSCFTPSLHVLYFVSEEGLFNIYDMTGQEFTADRSPVPHRTLAHTHTHAYTPFMWLDCERKLEKL